ncbi:Protein neprosin [Cardamine amara subsp. amara]|uniref:Protein neprosin n=1 Tax=Cardamine amara subsp. amara TaxID=228776 RepID=A0ABD0ZHH5_CARAN
MSSSCLIFTFILLLCLFSSSFSSSASPQNSTSENETLRPQKEIQKLKLIRKHLQKINKPAIKTIQSSDGDIIDCVPSHHQPAFDHPLLQGQRPMDPPEMPKGYSQENESHEDFQLWSLSGESCPEGTIPIRRTTEQDMLRATSFRRFGRKIRRVRRDSSSNGHEHAVGYVSGSQYYGAKASINVWTPRVNSQYEFSLSQIWVIAGSFADDLNTIEAGWQISPELYGDTNPRFFTYWTSDAYQATGCYNLLCSGFVQTNNRIAIGAAISPVSSYKGGQFDISLLIWKDPKHGHWWLQFGSGTLVGYWPISLFTHLREHGNMVQFGGEIVNTRPDGSHTSTQMGSGHFAGEGFGKASYFRNLQIVDWDNTLIPISNLRVLADHPNCYDIRGGVNRVWGNYFYYGGPGKNSKCP